MWRFIVPIGVFAALFIAFYAGLGRDTQTIQSPLIGKSAPTFQLPRVDDPTQKIGNADFAGKPYVLNVWGTWCVGCRQEHDVLLQIARRNEVPILGLNWNDQRDAAMQWLQQLGNPYTANAFDGEGRVAIDWGVYGAPETFLVDGNGVVIHKVIGPLNMQIWEQEFVPLLRGARGGASQ